MKKEKDVKMRKPFFKKWWFWAIVIILIFGSCVGKGNEKDNQIEANYVSESVAGTEFTKAVEPEETTDATFEILSFTIVPEELGKYGFVNTLNEGTEFEETQIVYHIPAGTYDVTNNGKYIGQIEACSDETRITDEGWEEPIDCADVYVVKPGETVLFTISDGYYLEIHINGELLFEKQ